MTSMAEAGARLRSGAQKRAQEGKYHATRSAVSWEALAQQFPATHEPGMYVDSGPGILYGIPCTLWYLAVYDDSGRLVGGCIRWPNNQGTTAVAPTYRRQGIGTALWEEAVRRWNRQLDEAEFTREGAAWANAYSKRPARDLGPPQAVPARFVSDIPLRLGAPPLTQTAAGEDGRMTTTQSAPTPVELVEIVRRAGLLEHPSDPCDLERHNRDLRVLLARYGRTPVDLVRARLAATSEPASRDPETFYRQQMASGDPAAFNRRHLRAGHPVAVAAYRAQQRHYLGPDPLAVDPCDWPAELANPGTVLTVPFTAALHGWRMWNVHGSALVAPRITDTWGVDTEDEIAHWRPGVNTADQRWCVDKRRKGNGRPKPHPQADGDCRCGIRAMQSRTALAAFFRSSGIGTPTAIARVAVWGRVAAYAPDDDWQYTLRASHARIDGPLYLAEPNAELGRRLGVQTRPLEELSPA